MAEFQPFILECPTVPTEVGNTKDVARFRDKVIQFQGTWVGSYQILMSNSYDGDLDEFSSPVTGNGFVYIPDGIAIVALRCEAFTSGTPIAIISGLDPL